MLRPRLSLFAIMMLAFVSCDVKPSKPQEYEGSVTLKMLSHNGDAADAETFARDFFALQLAELEDVTYQTTDEPGEIQIVAIRETAASAGDAASRAAELFKEHREKIERERSTRVLEELENELKEQKEAMEKSREKVLDLLEKAGRKTGGGD